MSDYADPTDPRFWGLPATAPDPNDPRCWAEGLLEPDPIEAWFVAESARMAAEMSPDQLARAIFGPWPDSAPYRAAWLKLPDEVQRQALERKLAADSAPPAPRKTYGQWRSEAKMADWQDQNLKKLLDAKAQLNDKWWQALLRGDQVAAKLEQDSENVMARELIAFEDLSEEDLEKLYLLHWDDPGLVFLTKPPASQIRYVRRSLQCQRRSQRS